jgi:hypothetical protein
LGTLLAIHALKKVDTNLNGAAHHISFTMVKKGRGFTVELVRADTKVAFKEHTKDGKTYAEVEPEVEYFVHLEVEPGPPVRAKIYVDGKWLGYYVIVGSPSEEKQTSDWGLGSCDRVNTTKQALKFANAEVFNSADDTGNLPFWTGNIEVKFLEIFDTGETTVARKTHQNTWDGGDVGFVMGYTEPKKKGVMSTQGSMVETKKRERVRKVYTQGRILETIKLHYCSTVGLVYAGIFGPPNPMLLARKMNENKRGAAQVAMDAATMPQPKKIRYVPEIDGRPFGLPIEHELFDLASTDEEKDD